MLFITGSYGSLARFRDVKRICDVGEHTLVGASGDISDFHYIEHMLEDLVTENEDWYIAPRPNNARLSFIFRSRPSRIDLRLHL